MSYWYDSFEAYNVDFDNESLKIKTVNKNNNSIILRLECITCRLFVDFSGNAFLSNIFYL